MKFYVRAYREQIKQDIEFPCFILVSNNWDDYGFKTTFQLQYYQTREERFIVGELKIMDIDLEEKEGFTKLNESFPNLEDNFASLGSSIEYYEKLNELKEKFNINIVQVLNSLNDLACMPGLLGSFENSNAFKYSLLRERESKSALQLGNSIITGNGKKSIIEFTFTTKLKNAFNSHEVKFRFDKKNQIPLRTFALIGKNGTGKTMFLSNLANTLNYSRTRDSNIFNSKKNIKLEEHEIGYFDTQLGPPFGKIIALSYSMFDTFRRPKPSKRFSYVYCGLRNQNEEIDKEDLFKRHIESLKIINKDQNKLDAWVSTLNKFLNLNELGYEIEGEWMYNLKNINEIEQSKTLNFSSGHSILLFTITELIANLSTNALVLFDEPENHLHPNAIANLINSINQLMIDFDSFAVISTHSPIVIQQVPSKNVYIFERDENTVFTRPLEMESFGENLTTISEYIFETNEVKDGYKLTLKELIKDYSIEEVVKMFENKLSLNAKIYLSSLIN